MAEFEGIEVFAVRSSSPEEDLAGSSFAGMYETFLGTTRDQLEETIAKAYSSMFEFRVMEYKAGNSIKLEGTCIRVNSKSLRFENTIMNIFYCRFETI